MKYREDRAGNRLSVLGFGCMRLPQKGRSIDLEEAEREIMEAYHAGVNYFDTAYIYSGSEAALGEILARNGIREKVNIATKLPQYLVGSRAALEKYFNEQLTRLRTDHSCSAKQKTKPAKGKEPQHERIRNHQTQKKRPNLR